MAEYSGAFAHRVCEEMQTRGLNPYAVEDRSAGRLSHMTVRRMMKGNPPSSDHIAEFVEAVEPDPVRRRRLADELLNLAGRRLRYPASVNHPLTVCAGGR